MSPFHSPFKPPLTLMAQKTIRNVLIEINLVLLAKELQRVLKNL